MVAIVITNFLTGVALGLLAMVIMFVISYSRTRVVRTAYIAGELPSLVMRSPEEVKVLETEGQYGYCSGHRKGGQIT